VATSAPPSSSLLLDQAREALELSKTELGGLFGVSRQALDRWSVRGVPSGRQAKAASVVAIADLLSRQLKHERIPGIARRPAEAYGGLSMLEMIRRDRHFELLESVRRSFDWASAV
jgi:hypothetical protein